MALRIPGTPRTEDARLALTGLALTLMTLGLGITEGGGSYYHLEIGSFCAFLGCLTALAVLVTRWLDWFRGRTGRWTQVLACLTLVACPLWGYWLSAVIVDGWNNKQVEDAREYCAALISRLVRYKQEAGVYPTTLEALERSVAERPSLLVDNLEYQQIDADCQFMFFGPAEDLSGFPAFVYDSRYPDWNGEYWNVDGAGPDGEPR